MKTLIVTDRAKINAAINTAKAAYIKSSALLHSVALSVIYHSVHYGDTRPMNAFFRFLNPNDGNAFRAYLGRISYEMTGTRDVRLWKYSDKEKSFAILTNDGHDKASEYKAAATMFVTDRLASENPGNWKPDALGEVKKILPFFMSQTFRSDLTDYTDATALAALRAIAKAAAADKAPGGGKVIISKDVLNAVENAVKIADRVVNNDSAVEERKADKAERKASPKRERKASPRRNRTAIKPDADSVTA